MTRRLLLINPNTDGLTTRIMTAIAAECAGGAAEIEGRTMTEGPPIITTEAGLSIAAGQVLAAGIAGAGEGFDGILISGFGDPGLIALRGTVSVPVTGIAEAGMLEASAGGRQFSVVTTTPHLRASIAGTAEAYGHHHLLASIRITPGEAEVTMADPARLAEALRITCLAAIREDGAEAIVIGGGPLATAARTIAPDIPVPLIEPVRAGARLALQRIRTATAGAN